MDDRDLVLKLMVLLDPQSKNPPVSMKCPLVPGEASFILFFVQLQPLVPNFTWFVLDAGREFPLKFGVAFSESAAGGQTPKPQSPIC
jgi:hypothetical protein